MVIEKIWKKKSWKKKQQKIKRMKRISEKVTEGGVVKKVEVEVVVVDEDD